jgi:hypothetical protein
MENPLPDALTPSDSPAPASGPATDITLEYVEDQAAASADPGKTDTTAAEALDPASEPAREHVPGHGEDAAEPLHSGTAVSSNGEASQEDQTPPEPGTLADYAARAARGRLNPEEELEASRLLQECLMGGRAEVAKAVAIVPRLPWMVTVQATASAWPEIKPTFRAQFLAGLARTTGEAAARVRLSIARGLYKVDPAAALKLILLTLKVLRDKETGMLEGKGASILSSVLIGRGKAWILQLPLGEMKPAEADLLVFAAVHGAFHQPQAPLTQLSIVKWAAAADRLASLPPALEQLVLKGISRWSGKWQASLRREVSPLPDSWVEILKSPVQSEKTSPAPNKSPSRAKTSEHSPELEEEGEDTTPSPEEGESRYFKEEPEAKQRELEDGEDTEEEDEEDGEDGDSDAAEADETSPVRGRPQKQRPVYVSKTVPSPGNHHTAQPQSRRGAAAGFNLQETLRQVEQYVSTLRNELQVAQKQLRQREDDRRQRRNERPIPVTNPGELSLEEAIRLNHQLESRNAELQSRIDELTSDSEARAASRGLVTDTPVEDPGKELRTLLGFKLKEDFEDFHALEQEARDLVVQQHYRTLLRHVFAVLEGEGVRFEAGPAN